MAYRLCKDGASAKRKRRGGLNAAAGSTQTIAPDAKAAPRRAGAAAVGEPRLGWAAVAELLRPVDAVEVVRPPQRARVLVEKEKRAGREVVALREALAVVGHAHALGAQGAFGFAAAEGLTAARVRRPNPHNQHGRARQRAQSLSLHVGRSFAKEYGAEALSLTGSDHPRSNP